MQPGKLDHASLGTFFEITTPDPVYQINKCTSPVLSNAPPEQPRELFPLCIGEQVLETSQVSPLFVMGA